MTVTRNVANAEPMDADLTLLLAEQGEHLDRALAIALPRLDSRRRAHIAAAIVALVRGGRMLEVAAETGISLPGVRGLCQNAKFRELWHAAENAGEEYRQARRAETADRHAVEGVERPVYQSGALVGHVREFDHKLLQFLMEADDPAKYRPRQAEGAAAAQVGVIVQFNMVGQMPLPPAPESVSKTLTGETGEPKAP